MHAGTTRLAAAEALALALAGRCQGRTRGPSPPYHLSPSPPYHLSPSLPYHLSPSPPYHLSPSPPFPLSSGVHTLCEILCPWSPRLFPSAPSPPFPSLTFLPSSLPLLLSHTHLLSSLTHASRPSTPHPLSHTSSFLTFPSSPLLCLPSLTAQPVSYLHSPPISPRPSLPVISFPPLPSVPTRRPPFTPPSVCPVSRLSPLLLPLPYAELPNFPLLETSSTNE
ncbi:unnamed protein product [Closterium sp. Naga37s-1]|nr:unnamed protein product [Closterium sp. Naga37s-1]